MPTGIEEAIGALVSLVVEAAESIGLSAFSGPADPNGATEAGDAAMAGPAPLLSAEQMEGQSGTCAVEGPQAEGATSPPVNGDRPPPAFHEHSAPQDSQPHARQIEMDPVLIDVSRPSPDLNSRATPSPAPGTEDTPWINFTPATGYVAPLWSVAPPAGERESPGPSLDAPGGQAPPAVPESGSRVPAELADAWQAEVTLAPSKLLLDRSGEELSLDIKQGVEEGLADALFDPDDSDAERLAKVALAGTVKTTTDVFADMVVVTPLDPGFLVRGFMRTGTGSAEGIEEVEQGNTLVGSVKVIGEFSGMVLTVLTPLRAMQAKGPPPQPGQPSITMYLERGGARSEKVLGAHNKVVIEMDAQGGQAARTIVTDVKATSAEMTVLPDDTVLGGETVAQARSFPTLTEKMTGPQEVSYTRPVTAHEAARAAAAVDRATSGSYAGVQGGIGPFSVLGENCSTYAAAVAREGGIPVAGRFGPHVTYMSFKYLSPLGATVPAAMAAEAVEVNHFYGQPAASQ